MKNLTCPLCPVLSIVAVLLTVGSIAGAPGLFAIAQPAESKPAQPAKEEGTKEDTKKEEPAKDEGKKEEPKKEEPKKPVSPYVLGYKLPDIDGKEQDLTQYKGKVILIVNVASRCGFTPQYGKLQKLYDDNKDAGLVILGIPANDFGGQEPGSNADIKQFCSSKYNVTFPMMGKISVTGKEQHPLYKQIASMDKPIGGDPRWNFTKYLVDRKGNVVARYEPQKSPDDTELAQKIKELLAAK
jgi:glutathione peroxidase